MICIHRKKEIQNRKKYQNGNWTSQIHRKHVAENNSKNANNYFTIQKNIPKIKPF